MADNEKKSDGVARFEGKPAAVEVIPEILEAARQAGARIDINVLLVQIAQRSPTPDEAIANSEKALALLQKYEDHNLKVFQARGQAVIEFKQNDPDEIEKRANNGTRRRLKMVMAVSGFGGLVGMMGFAAIGAPIVVTGLSGIIGMMCLAATAPLASGESVSANDVVRIVGAITASLPSFRAEKPQDGEQRGKKGRR